MNLRAEYALVMRYRPPRTAADKRMLDWLYDEGAHAVVVLPQVVVGDASAPTRMSPERPRGPSQLMLLAGLVVLLGLALAPARVDARVESDALLLARVVVSESGWDGWTSGDGYALHYAQLTVADRDGTSWRSAARALSPRATGSRPTEDARLGWVAGLREDLLAPMRWPPPPHAPWVTFRARWLAVLERAREVVTWDLELHDEWSPCEERPIAWAAPWHPPSPGLRALDCGDTANRFYAGPR